MKLDSLKYADGAIKSRRRIGRGPGSGRGTTAGRGSNGAKSRSGYKSRPWFEGGQMPLQRRLPKRGFTNYNRKEYEIVNLDRLSELIEESNGVITPEFLREKRVIRKKKSWIKILGVGEITGKIVVRAHAFSKTAREKIEGAGGKAEVIS